MSALLQAKGLYTLPNSLSSIPQGSLLEALNIVIDRDGIIEPRRGLYQWKSFGSAGSRNKQLFTYKDIILNHYDSVLSYQNIGSGNDFLPFVNNNGVTASFIEPETGRRARSAELNGNLYLTAIDAIKKISATTPQFSSTDGENILFNAGVSKALDPTAVVDYSTGGFMLPLSKVAYRIIFGYNDNNNVLVLGSPSGRYIVTNLSNNSANVKVFITLPQNLQPGYFAQIYRSDNPSATTLALLGTTADPTDELQQVGEIVLTAADIAAGSVTFFDQTSSTLQSSGAFLYTNQFSGEGIAQSNDIPPVAKDITLYRNSLFFANTQTPETKDLNIISVEGLQGIPISGLSLSSTTLTVTTSINHSLVAGETVALTIPNSYRTLSFSSVSTSDNTITITGHGLITGEFCSFTGGSLPTPVVANTIYYIEVVDVDTIKLIDKNNTEVDITTTGSGTLNEQFSIRGEYTLNTVSSNTFTVSVAANTTLPSSTNDKIFSAQVFPYFVSIQKQNNSNRYYFVGSVGKIALNVTQSNLDGSGLDNTNTFFINSFDNQRQYQFYFTRNFAFPNPDEGSGDYLTANRIPGNIVYPSHSFSAHYTSADGLFTAAAHGLTLNERVSLATGTGNFVNNGLYFVINPTTNTFQLSEFSNGTAVTGGSDFTSDMGVAASKTDLAELLGTKMSSFGDWATLQTTYDVSAANQNYTTSRFTILDYTTFLTGDVVWIDSNGSAGPAPSLPMLGSGYYIKSLGSSVYELYQDSSLLTKVTFTTPGSLTLTFHTNNLAITNTTSGDFGFNTNTTDYGYSQASTNVYTLSSPYSVGYGQWYNPTTHSYLIKRSYYPLVANKIDETARSLVYLINLNKANENVFAFYSSGQNDFSSRITLQSLSNDTIPFYLGLKESEITSYGDETIDFQPSLPKELSIISIGTGATPLITTQVVHGFSVGDTVVISRSGTTPNIDGVYTVKTVPTTSTFTITTSTVTVGSSQGYAVKGSYFSQGSSNPNRVYYSKFQQPDSVPALNYFDIGPKDKPIERILPLRDSLFIFKADGIYRISGTDANSGFNMAPFDSSNIILAPDSAVVLNNMIFMYSTQGVNNVTETGVSVISRPIENLLLPMSQFTSFEWATFGVAYETDRAYIMFAPTLSSDTVATQCFRYNTFTQCWTRWDKSAISGIVNQTTDLLYVGASDIDSIEVERKSFDRTDFSDRQYSLSINPNTISAGNNTILCVPIVQYSEGDAFLQTQYVSLAEIRNLALKLAIDPGIPSGSVSFYTNFNPGVGNSIATLMSNLVVQVNTDLSTSYTAPSSSDFATFQTQYNTFIGNLNSDTTLHFTNYKQSVGTKQYECNISTVNSPNTVIVDLLPPFIVGAITHLKGISSKVIYAPVSLGDPSIMKQVRESTVLFEFLTFKKATVSYATDLNSNYQSINFNEQGSGAWGTSLWGKSVFGGIGPSYPLRTLIPREHQRNRFLRVKFEHNSARFKYSLEGISLIPSSQSERAYK